MKSIFIWLSSTKAVSLVLSMAFLMACSAHSENPQIISPQPPNNNGSPVSPVDQLPKASINCQHQFAKAQSLFEIAKTATAMKNDCHFSEQQVYQLAVEVFE